MDEIGNSKLEQRWFRTAVLLRANHFQFERGDDYWVRSIGSRMLFWVIAGRGSVEVDGIRFDLDPGEAALFPWKADDHYIADATDPFLTGAAHLLPWHGGSAAISAWAGHGERDPLNRTPERQDRPWPGFESARMLSPQTAREAIRLGEAGVEYFTLDEPDEADELVLRSFGVLIAQALSRENSRHDLVASAPPSTAVMMEYVRSHIGDPLSAQALARVAGCSVSTVERRFRKHTGHSPNAWIRRERLLFAAAVLRTSRRRINEIAHEVGFVDPLHFSREFKRQFGYPPSHAKARIPLI